ncbi:tRNA Delta(2)-isopentenylpyrophosphate transferase [Pararhodospirillum photometricum DSM 122]|uniref:tRNA Delta(2)-isopentenylpyrophosphate transferase n=1 Tax=Pararhodospirillum photometricum DSM 122 TaxID=1150469 RepID=H6SSM4_PARPM|nr:tRNA Delta(2)-isopentenylpyrophosphate transferase [Pararhodospirillum photometricum DSM 122]
MARAWEVLIGTGRSLAQWWAAPAQRPALPGRSFLILVDPPRDAVRAACDARLAAMVEAGAVAEVAALVARDLNPALPVMRAVGVPDLAAHVRGALSLPEAVAQAQAATRQYAKRQATWARHQMVADLRLEGRGDTQDLESIIPALDNFIR